MLLRFRVSNHLSISDAQELSFAASSLKDDPTGLIACPAMPNGSVVPAAIIYGANASGKSNLVDAIGTMRAMVLWSHSKGDPSGGVPRKPFRLASEISQRPSQFDIDFVVDDVRYHYGFEVTDELVLSEWLYTFPGSHRRTLYWRESDTFHFGRWLKGKNSGIADLTRSNSLYLSAAAQNGHQQLQKIYEYFRSIRSARDIAVPGSEASAHLTGEGLDSRVIHFLRNMNTGIVGYRKKEIEISKESRVFRQELQQIMENFLKEQVELFGENEDKRITIELAHLSHEGERVYFDLDRESAGTRRLLIVLGLSYRAIDEGAPLCIDELDASLHTHAAEAVLQLFCSREINHKGAQLIATTHDTNLMKSEALRRDQLWLIEKNVEGATQVFPLTDIRTRKGDNIELGYLQGRYGALPISNPNSVQDGTN